MLCVSFLKKIQELRNNEKSSFLPRLILANELGILMIPAGQFLSVYTVE